MKSCSTKGNPVRFRRDVTVTVEERGDATARIANGRTVRVRRLVDDAIRRASFVAAIGAVSIALVGAAESTALAINPVQGGVVHSCFRTATGRNLRLIDPTTPAGTCKTGETALPWGQQGPKGDTGAAGAPGAPGAPGASGAPGAPGLSEYEFVPVSQAVSGAGGWVFDAACPDGKTAISGGYTLPAGSSVTESHPRDGDRTVWRLAFSVPGPTTIKLYLQCARTQ